MGLSLAGPSGVCLGLRALRWLACVDPVTDASGFLYRLSFDGGLGRCTGAVSCGRPHLPLRVGERHARVPCVCACARPSWPGRAGRPPGHILVRLTFSLCRLVFLLFLAGVAPFVVFRLPSPPPSLFFFFLPPFFFGPPLVFFSFLAFRFPRAPLVSFFLWFPAPGYLGLGALFLFSPPPRLVFLFFFVVRPRCLWLSLVLGPGCRGPWRCVLFVFVGLPLPGSPCAPASIPVPARPLAAPWWLLPPPPFFFVSRCFSRCRFVLRFFVRLRAPVVSGFLWFPAPGALGLGALCCLFCWPPAPRLSVRSRLFCGSCLPVGCPLVVAAPPPSLSLEFLAVLLAAALCSFFFLPLRAPVVPGFLWFPAPGALRLGALCCLFCWPLAPRLSVRSPLFSGFCPAAGCSLLVAAPPPPPLCLAVFLAAALCSVFFLFPFRAPVVSGFLWFPAPGALGLGAVCSLFCWPPAPRLSVRSRLFCGFCPAVGCSLVVAAPPPLCVSLFFSLPLCAPFFFFPFRAPVVSGFLLFPAPVALGIGAVGLFCRPPASRLSVRSCLFCVFPLAVGCFVVFAAPPPLLCLAVFVAAARCSFFFFFFFFCSSAVYAACSPPPPGACVVPCAVWCCRAALPFRFACCAVVHRLAVLWAAACCAVFVGVFVSVLCCAVCCCCVLCRVFGSAVWLGCSRWGLLPGFGLRCRVPCCAVCPWVRCCAALLRVVPPGVVLLCAVLFCCACLVSLFVVPCPLALPVALGPCALLRCVLRCSPALCALCRVCSVVACWCTLLFAALLRAVCVLGCRAVRSLSSPLCAVLCSVVLVRLRRAVCVVRAVAGAWCCGALLCVALFPLVFCGAVLGLAARGCLLAVCFGVGVPVWPRGLVPCGWCGLLWCPASLCGVLWCCAVWWCCAVVFCCRFAVLLVLALPPCGLSCRAVLWCWLSVLFCARWWCLCALVPCPSLPARTKTLIMTLCYPAPVSASLGHVVDGSGLGLCRFVADPRGCR